MPDFRVADTAPEHPKLRAAGLAAFGLWSAAGAWSMRELTDGWCPDYWVTTWPGGKKSAAALVQVGLWVREERNGIPGYRFHDWTDYQRPAQRFAEEREQARERARRYRDRTKNVTRDVTRHGQRESRNPNANVTIAPSPSPSPLPQRGDLGGDRPVPNGRDPRNDPPAPNLDPNNPRCADHAHITATERGPNCRACSAVRAQVETVDPRAAERAAQLAARNCSWCDADGWRIDPANPHRGPLIPGQRCDHQPAAVVAS